MAFEPGGYADKLGNRYEGRWVVRQLLLLLHERLRSITIEAIGDDEAGVDLWVERNDGRREAQQCKARNRSKSNWSLADLDQRGVLGSAKAHLNRSSNHDFALVSAVPASELRDISQSARDSSGDAESFVQHQINALGKKRRDAFQDLCRSLMLDAHTSDGRAEAFDFLRRTHVHLACDDRHANDDLRFMAETSVAANPDVVIAVLADFAENNLRKTLTALEVFQHVQSKEMQVRRLTADNRIYLQVNELCQDFLDSIRPKLAAGRLIPRSETEAIIDELNADDAPEIVILHGAAGRGKSGVLYAVAERLTEMGTPFIPIRLDRKSARGHARQFGIDLGLPDSPVVCLQQLAASGRGVLILDQLDALRWTGAHSAEGLGVCKSLLREVKSLRQLGCKLSVLISCRTFDLNNDPQIRQWLRGRKADQVQEVEVQELPDLAVKETVELCGLDPGRLTPTRRSLLRTVQNLAMWSEIVLAGEPSPDFDSATGLMREFWRNRRIEVEKAGITATERDALLDTLVRYMEEHAELTAPAQLIERQEKATTELQTLGVIQVSRRKVTFCHQCYLDFLIADRAAGTVLIGGCSVLEWLGERDRQSLFRREQLRQLLFLIADEDPARFVSGINELLSDSEVRFHIKQLALEALSQVSPTDTTEALVLALVRDCVWRDLILSLVVRGESRYVTAFGKTGLLHDWLDSGNAEQENDALMLVRSVADRCPELVASICRPLLRRGEEWARQIERTLVRSEPHGEPDVMFRLRLDCARQGALPDHFPWSKIAENNPARAIRMFATCLSKVPDVKSRMFSSSLPLGTVGSPDWRAVGRAARRVPRLTWRLLSAELIRLLIERRRQRANERKRREFKPWEDRIHIPRLLISALRAAGREIARRAPETFLRVADELDGRRSRIIQEVLVSCHAALPPAFADIAVRWLLDDKRRFQCGAGVRHPKWNPATCLIAKQSPHCSDEVFAELETAVHAFRDPEEKRLARWWLEETRDGDFRNKFGAAQYFLLPALDATRRSTETVGRIGVLAEKFSHESEEFFCRPKPQGGGVRSPIDLRMVDHLSDTAWLSLITNGDIPRRGAARWGHSYRQGTVIETSVEMFARDLRTAALREPERFSRLALRLPDAVPPDYLAAIMQSLHVQSPPSEVRDDRRADWSPASATSVQAVLEHIPRSAEAELCCAFCTIIVHRDDIEVSEKIVHRLADLVDHCDPDGDTLHVHCNQRASQCSVQVLEHNAINCVRGLAAHAIAAILFRRPDLLDRFRPEIERLLEDPHPVVRLAAVGICLPVWNLERDSAVHWLVRAASEDRVGACRDACRVFNFAFPAYAHVLCPLIRRMAASPHEDVAEVAAAEMAARWVFFGLFDEEVKRCCGGSVPQRKGVAKAAAQLVTTLDYSEPCRTLLARYFDDSEEQVRRQAMFRVDQLLRFPETAPFLHKLAISSAFRDRPEQLLRALEQHPESLVPFSDVIFDACKNLCGELDSLEVKGTRPMSYAGEEISPLLLRLYEQAEGSERLHVRRRCLDAWDALLEHRVGNVWSLTKQLSQ
ncbi:MAG: hypothetical protein RIC55_04505 [Pirellulaceae bacterium]